MITSEIIGSYLFRSVMAEFQTRTRQSFAESFALVSQEFSISALRLLL